MCLRLLPLKDKTVGDTVHPRACSLEIFLRCAASVFAKEYLRHGGSLVYW